jgi:hypothetical protein
MTWDQICEAYAGEWVLMVDVDWVNDTDLDLRSAVVVSHGKHRQWTRARELIPDGVDCTHLFIFKPGYEAGSVVRVSRFATDAPLIFVRGRLSGPRADRDLRLVLDTPCGSTWRPHHPAQEAPSQERAA